MCCLKYEYDSYKKFIDKACDTGTICHFWFHPSLDEWFLKRVLPEILEYAANRREEGKLWIGTMAEAADFYY